MAYVLSHRNRQWLALFVAMIVPSVPTMAAPPSGVFRVQLVADDMCCSGCAQKVAAQLYSLPGVTTVQSDVPKRLVTITGKPSPKLTLERIWQAVEKGKGGPSKLVTQSATYTLTRPEKLVAEERLEPGRYTLEVGSLRSNNETRAITNQLDRIPGVERVGVDVDRRMFAIHATATTVLSPWALVGAAERAHAEPTTIAGPFGMFAIERPSDTQRAATAQLASPQNPPQNQGELR